MEIIDRKIQLCPSCMEEHEVQTVLFQEHNTFKGVKVEYEARYYYCTNSDELLSDESMTNENYYSMKRAYGKIISAKIDQGNITEYGDKVAFHPGYYIADIIEDWKSTPEEFAKYLRVSEDTVRRLINGKTDITDDIAGQLSVLLGMSADVWMNLQSGYNQKIEEIRKLNLSD